jgi:anti-sigma regulatory factor (Ser/Thr protein kinase)
VILFTDIDHTQAEIRGWTAGRPAPGWLTLQACWAHERWLETGATVRELALHVLDILENAMEAGATRVELTIEEDQPGGWLTITIRDNGRGMDAATLAQVTSPFFTTRNTRHVGLGLPLFAAAAERAGGQLVVESAPGRGTTVLATFGCFHPDRQPLGDLPGTLLAFLLSQQAPDLHYHHRVDEDAFDFDTVDIRTALGDVPLSNPTVRWWLAGFLQEGEAEMAAARWEIAVGF